MTLRDVHAEIREKVTQHPVVLFMKGSRSMPQCGFSATVIAVLNDVGAKYEDINVLADSELREGIKAFSDWPTIPQLYIDGEFVGGCDIIRQMHGTGELHKMLEKHLA